MKWIGKKRPQSVIGLSIADGQLRVAHAARAKNAVAIVRSTTATLSLDLFHPETELVGREIKNHLEAAHIRERHCVVVLPAAWLMMQHTPVPELSPADTASLLQIEAEKGFPCDPDELQIAHSLHRAGAASYVSQLAIRQEQLARLTAVLKSAGLKPLSYSLGLDALAGAIPAGSEGRMTLVVEPKSATLVVAAGGGIVAWRTFEAAIASEAGESVINGAALARELRITYEQISPDLRQSVRDLWLLGDERGTRQLEDTLGDWARDAGVSLHRNTAARLPVAEEIVEEAAMRFLKDDGATALEFLPPRPSRWSTMMARYNSKRLATAGFAAAGVVLLVTLAFGWQEFRLWSLRREWNGMAAQVKDLDAVTARIREFRPWYDMGNRNLTIMKRVVECFPDNGSVSAKTFEIQANGGVSITGTARDNASLLRTLDQLRQAKEIQGLKIEQIRGKTPAQFTFTFRWNGSPGT